mmetsp:Transcript_32510/g.103665  ORF Transcript_32510/g.103665 Transcript_32510/m.103665 type:complete len:223 (+) Transcript_32510:46-714(+)
MGGPLSPFVLRSPRALAVRGGALEVNVLSSFIASRPVSGTVGVVGTYVAIEMLGLPSTPLCMAMGFAYGLPLAFGLALSCSTVAAMACFQIGRTKLRPASAQKICRSKTLRAIDAAVAEKDFITILLLRLFLPMPPAVNYLYGATSASFAGYAAATVLGNTPGILACVAASKGLALRPKDLPPAGWAVCALLAITLAWLAYNAANEVRRHLDAYADDGDVSR